MLEGEQPGSMRAVAEKKCHDSTGVVAEGILQYIIDAQTHGGAGLLHDTPGEWRLYENALCFITPSALACRLWCGEEALWCTAVPDNNSGSCWCSSVT